jgi:diacylglycerol O-acyltransferase / wax synthase
VTQQRDLGALEDERMAAADVAWLHMDRPTNLMVVNCVFWFDRPLNWDAVEAAFVERLIPAFPHFAMRVVDPPVTVGGVSPRWEPVADFRVADHLHRATLPAPGGEAELHAYAGEQVSVRLDPDRPLWSAHLLDGYGSGSAILLRTHHAIADGTALVQALLTLVDAPAEAGLREFTGESGTEPWLLSVGRRTAQLGRIAFDGWTTAVSRPDQAWAGVRSLPQIAAMLLRLGFGRSDDDSVLRGELSGTKQLTWATALPLSGVKSAGKRIGASVNDLALTAIAGALRRYLQERGQEVTRLTATVPVNLRPADEPFDPGRGNQFGLAFVRLPVGEPDRRRRLEAVQVAMNRAKSTDEAVVVFHALAVMGAGPEKVEQAWLDLFAGRASAVITNIPGPSEQVSLAGVPLAGFTAWVPSTGPIGVGLSVCSYAGRIILGIAVDTALVDDSENLLRALSDEFDALLAELDDAT